MAWRKGHQYSKTYAAVWIVVKALLGIFFPIRFEGREKLKDRDAPYILIGNHYSNLDPLIVAVAQHSYQVSFLGKKELTKNRLFARFLSALHMIPVDRHNTDMEAMRACVRLLRSGEVLGIFPEGTRHHQGLMTETESGTAVIALRGGAPLIPLWITRKPRLFRPTRVVIGEDIPCADLREQGVNRESCETLMKRIADVYARMAETASR